MSDEPKKIDVYESRRFAKALAKLPDSQLRQVEDQIELIISEPTIGVQKKATCLIYGFINLKSMPRKCCWGTPGLKTD